MFLLLVQETCELRASFVQVALSRVQRMDIFIVDISCWLLWVAMGVRGLSPKLRIWVYNLSYSVTTRAALKQANLLQSPQLESIPRPIHLLLPKKCPRLHTEQVVPHLWTGSLPTIECFRQLAPHIFVAVPEFCFLLLARSLPLWRLIAFGYELCGGYYLVPTEDDEWGFDYCFSPTDTGRLRAFVERCKGMPGYAHASAALNWVLDNSRSPRETIVAMLLCLPTALGGFALPLPLLNHEVALSETASYIAGAMKLKPDLCWPAFKVAVEYDSDKYHTQSKSQRIDTQLRAAALREDGWFVISLTPEIVGDPDAFYKMVIVLADHIQFTLAPDTEATASARRELRQHIVDQPLRYW